MTISRLRSYLLQGLVLVFPGLLAVLSGPAPAWAGEAQGGHTLLSSISISILMATALAYLASRLKQPLILAYLLAGVVIGPQMGFGWVQNKQDIETIAEIGLILLLFMIGLELNLKKIREAGKSLVITGIWQFVLCVAMGLGFFWLMGFTCGPGTCTYTVWGVPIRGGPYDLLYLSACLALSSTTIVVKLLYEKFELDTLAGRLTLGVLIFQDLWAIVLLGLQPNLANPQILIILYSFLKGAALVVLSLLLSKYALGFMFRQIAKLPELMLVASLGWCFLVAGLAHYLGLSLEMGALIAGVAMSTFPYNFDIIGKILNIRDFFLTLFFVALGMVIPNPLKNPGLMGIAALAAGFLVVTRFLSVFPILYSLQNGLRVSILTSVNLSQLSEFALVITVIGAKFQPAHIGPDIVTLIVFVFVITALTSTYMIKYSHGVQHALGRLARGLGCKDLAPETAPAPDQRREIALLGFFRVASSLLAELEATRPDLLARLVVVDFNPEVYPALKQRGVKVVYGDVSNLQTLHHAGLEEARLVISTITDDILVGTSNLQLLNQVKRLAPAAKVVVTAAQPSRALELYRAGADFVLLPNQAAAQRLLPVLDLLLSGAPRDLREEELRKLSQRREILA